ncbi:immunoglobulin-like domain-containing protein, partial [Enterococcus faecium]|uniref:immunoglobulin-like domain-containing protein n=1 Tax=Enterococcus faecium TaxID=1352 RepID=UPI0023B2C41E
MKIELEQYYDEKTLLGSHVIFDSTNVEEIVDEAPSITGVGNRTIKVGTAFNPLDGVKATDKEDGDLTSKIQIDGTIDNEKSGEYTLIYSVEDSKNNKTTANRVIKVVEEVEEGNYRNVMYYGDWSVWDGQGNFYPKDIPANRYTHINFSFLDMDANGDLLLTDPDAAFSNPVGTSNSWDDALSGVVPGLV